MSELSLGLSKRLHELGVKVESKYAWWIHMTNEPQLILNQPLLDKQYPNDDFIPAHTFCELWKVMPDRIDDYALMISKSVFNKTCASYKKVSILERSEALIGSTLCESPLEALGQLAIWLAENGHMEADNG